MIFATAMAIAISFWGGTPPACDTLKTHRANLPSPVLGKAVRKGHRCSITFSYRLHSFKSRCHVAEHELGHLWGRGHSTRPHTVMYYKYTGWVHRSCRR